MATIMSSPINRFEYGFLKGDKDIMVHRGAAFNAVWTWCGKHGYGTFGKPTKAGERAMETYELERRPINYEDL